MATFLLIVGAVVLWLPVHAYGAGRYVRARTKVVPPFDPTTAIRHKDYCHAARKNDGSLRYGSLFERDGCNEDCEEVEDRTAVIEHLRRVHDARRRPGPVSGFLLWPIRWPLEAAFRAGQSGGAPILTQHPDEVKRALDALDKYLDGELEES